RLTERERAAGLVRDHMPVQQRAGEPLALARLAPGLSIGGLHRRVACASTVPTSLWSGSRSTQRISCASRCSRTRAWQCSLPITPSLRAARLADRGITVNTLAPGAIASDFRGGAVRDTPQIADAVAGMTALGRVGEADDIGTAIAGLFASRSRWITGQRIEASGGMHL
ncbi:MAG: SDR family oxidoreductase, partial [Actinobacteria bacterium]|nr:SDR family oxidoreductase [Actinomycetota bacterium]